MTDPTPTPGCGKPGHDTDYISPKGKKQCRECRLERNRRAARERRQRRRKAALDAYGGQCTCCGETTEVFLCINHVDDYGVVHRKITSGGNAEMYKWLEDNDYPEGFQILCYNCNYAESQGGCPHQED